MAHGEMILWRIAKHTADYSADDMRGGGAMRTGGRWNSKGDPVVYTSTTISLATLATLAHVGDHIAMRNAFLVRVVVPAAVWKLRERVELASLDVTWSAEPPGSITIGIGDAWLAAATSPLLMVPSVIVPEEFNVLINPAHPAAAKIRAKPVRQHVYDPRL